MQALSHLYQTIRRASRDDVRASAVEQWLGRGLKAQADQCLSEPLPEQWIDMIDRGRETPQQLAGRARRS
jgi:hypothetical protein